MLKQEIKNDINKFKKAIEIDSKNSIHYYNLAVAQFKTNDIEGAKNNFLQAIELNPLFSMAYANLSQTYAYYKDFKNAIFYLKKAISLDNCKWDYYYELAYIYSNAGEFNKAIECINTAIEKSPNNAMYYHRRAVIYHNYLYYDEAYQDINKAIKLEKNSSLYYQSRGIMKLSQSLYEKSIDDFTKAIKLDSNDYLSYVHRAYAYLCLGSYRTVINDCNGAIKLNPECSYAYLCRARAKAYLDDKNGEKDDFRKSILLELKENSFYSNDSISLFLYRPINRHTIKGLKESFLWFSHPDNFNDPLDTKFYKDIATEKSIIEVLSDIRIRSMSFNNTTCNTLLWSYYSKNHTGIMIEYKFNVDELITNNISLFKVIYSDFINPENKMLWENDKISYLYTKSKMWKYENEWRLITTKENLRKNKLKKCFSIESITFGLNTSKEDIELIENILPNCKFYKMVQEDKYRKPFSIIRKEYNKTLFDFEDSFDFLNYFQPQSLKESLEFDEIIKKEKGVK